jgi:hypothetical protein
MNDQTPQDNTEAMEEAVTADTTEKKEESPKAEEGTKAEDTPEAGKAEDPAIEYEDFTLPEGFQMEPETLGQFQELAKGLKLPQAEAQKFIDMAVSLQTKAAEGMKEGFEKERESIVEEGIKAHTEKQSAEWLAETQKKFGKELDTTLSKVTPVMDKFFAPEFKEFLEETGMGNHPALVEGLFKMSKHFSEDEIVTGSTAPTQKTHAEILYGSK